MDTTSTSNPEEEGLYELRYHNHPSSSSMDRTDRSSPAATPSRSILSADSFTYCRTNSEISTFSDPTDDSASFTGAPSPRWPPSLKSPKRHLLSRLGIRHSRNFNTDEEKIEDHEQHLDIIELEMMKERFSKLLLGEDMSGSGKGVSTAVTISNAITNLYASVFGQHQRLEPLHHEKKMMWRREMSCLLSVCDYIVEFVPIQQTLRDGSVVEVMENRPRSDIQINLPALRKLDSMLLDILATFEETEFWYVEPGSILGTIATRSGSFRKLVQPQRTDEKWWLPVPCVPVSGLSDKSRKHLRYKRDSANQIHKAAMAINSTILAEMEIPESYMTSLPKSGKASVGESIYRHMSVSDKFSPGNLLDSLNINSEHGALELADRVEASMYVWRRKACLGNSRSSWDLMKELMSDVDRSDKNHVLAGRAHSLLFCLKQRYPELSQTSLDTCKIQLNRDVGQAILESYSRVLEGLAFNIVAWMDDVLFVDKKMRNKDN